MRGQILRAGLLLLCTLALIHAKCTSRKKRALPTVSATGEYRFAAVAADNLVCSEIGRNIIENLKGTTVDAAIATVFCSGIMNSHTMGIGGGFLSTISDGEKNVWTLNAREVAPLAATEDMYVNNTGASVLGGLAVAVPGELAGYIELHKHYGKLPFSCLVAPAQKMAAEGVPVTASLAAALVTRQADVFREDGLREVFTKNGGTELLVEGDIVTRPKLAATLQRLIDDGPETFYTGSLADDIVADIQECGGIITNEDLEAYQVSWKAPACITLDNAGFTSCGPPPPSSAAVLNFILNIMDEYNLSPADRETTDDKILLYHRTVEAMKFGFGKRSLLGDDDFIDNSEALADLQSNDFAAETRAKINDANTLPFEDYDSAFIIVDDHGTSHLSISGKDRFALGITSTINTFLGSKCLGSRTGILFNNEMDDFSTPGLINNFGILPSPTNFIVSGKRPMSSMSPMLILDDDHETVGIIGSSGGTRIISGVARTILNNFVLGYSITEAVDDMRFHHQLLPDRILHEPNWDQAFIDGLAAKGHTFSIRTNEFSVQQFVRIICDNRSSSQLCKQATSDRRRGGAPDGF